MSVQRLIQGRVADAVSAFREACAELEKSINSSSRETTLLSSSPDHDDDDDDNDNDRHTQTLNVSAAKRPRRNSSNEHNNGTAHDNAREGAPSGESAAGGDTSSFLQEKSKRLLEAELAQCQTKIVALETERDMELAQLRRETLSKEQRILELSNELEKVQREKDAALEERIKLEQKMEKESLARSNKVQSLERESQLLKMRIDDIENERKASVQKAEHLMWLEKDRRIDEEQAHYQKGRALIEMTAARNEALQKLRVAEDAVCTTEQSLNRLQDENESLKNEVTRLKKSIEDHAWASDLLDKARALEDKMAVMAQWETELVQLRKDNAKLLEDRSNVSLFREQLRILHGVEQKANKLRERCAQLESDLDVSQRLCLEWENALMDLDPSLSSPEAVIRRIRKLQDAELCLLEENSKLKTEMVVRENGRRLEGSEESKTIKRLERRLRLVTQERDSYKTVLDSYERDVTVNPLTMTSRRIAQLEATLSEYRVLVNQLEGEGGQRQRPQVIPTNCVTTEVQTDPCDYLGGRTPVGGTQEPSTSSTLGSEVCSDMVNVRILHYRENPLDVAHRERMATLKNVEKENERLRAKLKAFEERGLAEQPDDESLMELLRDDPRKLRAELEAAKKWKERILAVFKKTSKEFRQAVYCLTGYRIDMKSNRCVLRHVYAEAAEDQLEFEIGENGFLHLFSNDYSLRLSNLTSEYLEKMDSIPAFLAALTLQLFSSQTMMIHPAEQPSMFFSE